MSASDLQLYQDLAVTSGGQAVEVTKSDLSVATSIIEDSSAGAVVGPHQKNIPFPDVTEHRRSKIIERQVVLRDVCSDTFVLLHF